MTLAHTSVDRGVRQAHASDASGLELVPEGVARPRSVPEVAEVMAQAAAHGTTVTAAGGQTSTTAASITDRGIILSMRNLERVLDIDIARRRVRVDAGAGIGAVKRAVAEHGLLLACDPTSEDDATIGGAVACNASGARSLRYGAIRQHVLALDIITASGETLRLRRPQLEKNTVGYFPVQDPVDWFIGSEGTLGVVVAAEFALLPLPERVFGLGVSFNDEPAALAFVSAARMAMERGTLHPRCLEYLDTAALEIVRAQEGGTGWSGEAFVYIEEECAGDQDPDYDGWLALIEVHGASDSDVQVFDSDSAIRTARRLRHAVPATMHERAAPFRAAGGRRISTDWAVPYQRLAEAIAASRAIAHRHGVLMPAIYGHAGNGHPHQNFIARTSAEVDIVYRVVAETLELVIGMGGTVAAEHGIGKIKRPWMPLQLSPLQRDAMAAFKQLLDPRGLLAPGNLF